MSAIVGIDLGTTHSLICVLQNGLPQLIPNDLGQVLTPSIVGVDESGAILVGSHARELQVIYPERCVGVFKRHMGNEKWTAEIGGKRMTAIELSSCVLRALKADAESSLKREVTRAVITVPAYFNEDQRRATILAGQLAGLQVERILNEPTAAAIACGFSKKDEDRIAVVVDLGGGTFDISIVELFEGTLEIRASAGDIFLGGEDFTNALMAIVLQQLGMQFERAEMQQPLMVARLRRESEVAKRKLSSQPSAEVRIPDAQGHFGENPQKVVVTREQFDVATKKLIDRLLLPLRQALGDAKLNRTQIQDVILVGGATRMPCVQEKMQEMFDSKPQFQLNPDEVVALGAGIHAGVVGRDDAVRELIVTDVSPFTMGIEVSQEVAGEYREGFYLPIINRNTVIPVSRVKQVTTLHPNQTVLEVKVYQGEARKVADNSLLGKFTVKGIPPGPAGQAIDVRFTYDLNGVLEVEATIVETQRKATHVLQRRAGNLTPAQLSDAVKRMQAFKIHPRENADNRHLIQRAERMYAELSIQHRDMLDELLQGFELVLEENNKQAIEKYRAILQEFLDRFDNDWGNHGELGFNSDDSL